MYAIAALLALMLLPRLGAAQAVAQVMEVQTAEPAQVVYVVRRGWHIDIGFAADEISGPLTSVVSRFPGLQFLFFGFGDRHYLLAKKHHAPVLLAALWRGPGMILATALASSPAAAFGADQVIELSVSYAQTRALLDFVWRTVEDDPDSPQAHITGPYEGSMFFSAQSRYSAVHTCNTWVAEALQNAGLPVHSAGVIFAGQLWSQVKRLQQQQAAADASLLTPLRSPPTLQ